jgi:hypothetical protein
MKQMKHKKQRKPLDAALFKKFKQRWPDPAYRKRICRAVAKHMGTVAFVRLVLRDHKAACVTLHRLGIDVEGNQQLELFPPAAGIRPIT